MQQCADATAGSTSIRASSTEFHPHSLRPNGRRTRARAAPRSAPRDGSQLLQGPEGVTTRPAAGFDGRRPWKRTVRTSANRYVTAHAHIVAPGGTRAALTHDDAAGVIDSAAVRPTPSILGCESRPVARRGRRFLCAHVASNLVSRSDRFLQFRNSCRMAGRCFWKVLAAEHLKDEQLRVPPCDSTVAVTEAAATSGRSQRAAPSLAPETTLGQHDLCRTCTAATPTFRRSPA